YLCKFNVFFFSSRRRHTRFSRDWSSDVCSSDLELSIVGARNLQGDTLFYPLTRNWHVDGILRLSLAPARACETLQQPAEAMLKRSEERRVGTGSNEVG